MSLELRRRLMVQAEPKDIIIDARKGGVSGDAANDAALMDVIYAQKWSKSPNYMTKREAEKVTDIGTAFRWNTNITNFDALKYFTSLTSIGSNAFNGCSNITLTSLPENITSIGANAFSGCTKLALTSLPSDITNIGDSAFKSCSNITLTSLPSGITRIYATTFNGCIKLALTSLPENITSIGSYAFGGCSNITLTSLPENVTSIGHSTFNGCTKITDIKILNTSQMITSALDMFTSNPTIRVPNSLLAEYQADTYWSTYTLVGY